jgi:hypothetical protein
MSALGESQQAGAGFRQVPRAKFEYQPGDAYTVLLIFLPDEYSDDTLI